MHLLSIHYLLINYRSSGMFFYDNTDVDKHNGILVFKILKSCI